MKTEHKKYEDLAASLSKQRDEALVARDSARTVASRALAERDEARGELKRLLEKLLRSLSGEMALQSGPLVDGDSEELLLIRTSLKRVDVLELGAIPRRTLAQVDLLVKRQEETKSQRDKFSALLKRLPKNASARVPHSLLVDIVAALGPRR